MEELADGIIDRIPILAGAKRLSVQRIGGLTNRNYIVNADGTEYVLRLGGPNAGYLGINREHELEALYVASRAGIAPEVIEYILHEGHLLTRLVAGKHWATEEYRTEGKIEEVARVLKRLHSLPPISADACPFKRVRRYVDECVRLDVPLPKHVDRLLETVQSIELDQQEDKTYRPVFTHNDLVSVNIIQSDSSREITLLDFEFAGMGDPYHDLASLVYCHDNVGPIPSELEELLLESYFGSIAAKHHLRLAGMKFMLMLFFSMWGLLQHGLLATGSVQPVEYFDYLEYGEYLIEHEVSACASAYRTMKKRV